MDDSVSYYKEGYDPAFNPANFIRYASKRWEVIREYLPLDNLSYPPYLLDLGCGEGSFLDFFHERIEISCIGLDFSYQCCLLAQQRKRGGNALVQGDGVHLPFKDLTFDIVFSNALLHHVLDIKALMAEAMRVARPNGVVAFVEPNRFHPLQIGHGLSRKAEHGTLRFSIKKTERLIQTLPNVSQYWIRPINTFLYIRQKFPPAGLRSFFIRLEDMIKIAPFCTHYMIIIRRGNSIKNVKY